MPGIPRLFRPLFACFALLFSAFGFASAQSPLPVPQSRILQAVDDSRPTTLAGNTHPLARAEFDQGTLADAVPLHRMLPVLPRSAPPETPLQQTLHQQQD